MLDHTRYQELVAALTRRRHPGLTVTTASGPRRGAAGGRAGAAGPDSGVRIAVSAPPSRLTDANGAIFDVRNAFHGCVTGINEILRRDGLLINSLCLDEGESLSPGQAEEIDRVLRLYPELRDDDFVAEHRSRWLS